MKKMFAFGAVAVGCVGSAFAQGRLLAIDTSSNLYELDMTTGARALIGHLDINSPAALAYDASSGTMYVSSASNNSLYTLDLNTLTTTFVGPFGTNFEMQGLEWDSSTGTLYGASTQSILYTVNSATGATTRVGDIGFEYYTNLGYNSDTDIMYASAPGEGFFIVDRTSGGLTFLGALPALVPNGLAYNAANDLMYMIDNLNDNLYTVDLDTGTANLVGSTGPGDLSGLVWVPTPASAALLGLGGLAGTRRRR